MHTIFTSFSEISAWLRELPNQIEGVPCMICQTGEPYVAFKAVGLARPDDLNVIETEVAGQFGEQLRKYFDGKNGMIYWRTPFEIAIEDYAVATRYTESGQDIDPLTNRRCVMDRNWKRLAAYCRVYRARHSFGEDSFEFAVSLRKRPDETQKTGETP